MKTSIKAVIITFALLLFSSYTANAQIGNIVGKKIKEKAEKTIGKAVDKAIDNATDDILGKEDKTSKNQDDSKTETVSGSKDNDKITPEKIMSNVPKMPTQQQVAEYLCESQRANPRTVKMLTNPTTAFLAKNTVVSLGGYSATLANGDTRYFELNEQILSEIGITQEQFDAMSEEEQQEISRKYADELEKRYYKTMERLGRDEEYNRLFEEYNKFEDEIVKIYNRSDSLCRDIWKTKFSNKSNPSEEDVCAFYRAAMPIHYKAVLDAMELRKNKQLAVAIEIDNYVEQLAEKHPEEVYAGLYNQALLCASAYSSEAFRVTTLTLPTTE